MFTSLKRLFGAKPKIARLTVSHPTLGPITYSEEEGAWMTDATHADLGFCFSLAGDEAPDARLLAHAESVAREPAAFRKTVVAFLDENAKRFTDRADIVRSLKIGMVCLFWPDRPEDGMIYFAGGERYGVWRCDYKNRQPMDLGFDS